MSQQHELNQRQYQQETRCIRSQWRYTTEIKEKLAQERMERNKKTITTNVSLSDVCIVYYEQIAHTNSI